MFDKFTDRSRKSLSLARSEALRLKHEFYGTEHLLLGLILEGSGVACTVLRNLDISIGKVHQEIERCVESIPSVHVSCDMSMTAKLRQSIGLANAEARHMGHSYVGTEHLLLGLLSVGESIACQILLNCGVKTDDVRKEVLCMLGVMPIEQTQIALDSLQIKERLISLAAQLERNETRLAAIADVVLNAQPGAEIAVVAAIRVLLNG